MDAFLFLIAPFLMCLMLVGIHCYLGLHVLAREVIFVDLALAQTAALGSTIAFLFHYEQNDKITYFISLFTTLVAALFLTLMNHHKKKISQEALIGILYAFASALLILLWNKMSHGSEHIKHVLVGQILWVTWSDVLKVFLIYSLVGGLHFIFRKELLSKSFGRNGHWKWDFLFYVLFGVVITSSVRVAGVLLVFSFLIVPAVLSTFFYKSITSRLIFGWIVGLILSTLGVFLSYFLNLPTGALIVVIFTSIPLLLTTGLKLSSKSRF